MNTFKHIHVIPHLTRNLRTSGLCLAALLLVASCTAHFDEINRKEYEVTYDEMQRENYNLGTALRGLQGLVIPTQEHSHQFIEVLFAGPYAGYYGETHPKWDNSGKGSTYNPETTWLEAAYSTVFTNTYPYYRDLAAAEDEVAKALGKLYRVLIMQRETDMFGPIPYTEMMNPLAQGSFAVAYDTQEAVYTQMLTELDEVSAVFRDNLNLDKEAFRKFDNVYYGDISKWLKFTNSLKLRLALRMSYAAPDKAKAVAEQAVLDGVILGNEDNAFLTVEENRANIIFNEWQQHAVGADIICYMNGYKDPRREKMFTKVPVQEGDNSVQGYAGVRIGIICGSDLFKWYSKPVLGIDSKYLWMNAAEVAFLRAEGALRGWDMGEEAKDLYEKGVSLSFAQYGVKDSEYLTDVERKPDNYNDPAGTYTEGAATSEITIPWQDGDENFEANLERIITQKWIAIFPNAVEAWSEYRRTDYPKLLPVVTNNSGGAIDDNVMKIRRLNYPPSEYSENGANIQTAVDTDLGGRDNIATKLWWDKKTR